MGFGTIRAQLAMGLATIALFVTFIALNEWLFRRFELVRGVNWIYLPAGIRLVCALLFAEAGALGLLAVGWAAGHFFFFPGDPQRAFVGGVLTALAPWLVYRGARHFYGLEASLANLTPARLLVLGVACSLVNPLLHHLYFAARGQPGLAQGFAAMFVGDLLGTLVVLYAAKAVLSLLARTGPRGGSSFRG